MGTFTPSDVLTADPDAMATYERVRLELAALATVTDPAQIDDEVVGWLREAGKRTDQASHHG